MPARPENGPFDSSPEIHLDLTNRDDLSYLKALVDVAPRLTSRTDMRDPLTDFWRQVLVALITNAKDQQIAEP
jgi:hypothetical protein